MPTAMSPISPKPLPSTILPASQPAMTPTIRMTRRPSPVMCIVPTLSLPRTTDTSREFFASDNWPGKRKFQPGVILMCVRSCESENLSHTNAASDDAGECARVVDTHRPGDRHWYAAAARRYRACRSCRPGGCHWARNSGRLCANERVVALARMAIAITNVFTVDLHFVENPSKTNFPRSGSAGFSKTAN